MGDTVILSMLFIIAPLCGLLGVFIQAFLWVFIAVTLLVLIAMWALNCFAPRGRAFMSGVLLVLVVVALIAVVDLSPDEGDFPYYGDGTISSAAQTATEQTTGQSAGSGPAFVGLNLTPTPGVTAPIVLASDSGTETDPNASAVLGVGTEVSAGGITSAPLNANYQAAQQVLNTYMQMWQNESWEEMVEYTLPSWRTAVESPRQQLFWAYTSFKLNSWTITGESATVSDSASFTVIANTTRNTGTREQITQQYNALLFSVDGSWYVDPDSMRNGIQVTATEPPTAAGDTTVSTAFTPEPTTDPNLELWYNSQGGEYYHSRRDCSEINLDKYGEYMKSFRYEELEDEPYSKLLPCRYCDAPAAP